MTFYLYWFFSVATISTHDPYSNPASDLCPLLLIKFGFVFNGLMILCNPFYHLLMPPLIIKTITYSFQNYFCLNQIFHFLGFVQQNEICCIPGLSSVISFSSAQYISLPELYVTRSTNPVPMNSLAHTMSLFTSNILCFSFATSNNMSWHHSLQRCTLYFSHAMT